MPAPALFLSLLLPQLAAVDVTPDAVAGIHQPAELAVAMVDGVRADHSPWVQETGVEIKGPVELKAAEAASGARLELERWAQSYGDAMLAAEVERSGARWIPSSWIRDLARRRVDPWTAADLAVVVDERVAERQHEFGVSYQAILEVAERSSGRQRLQRTVQTAVHDAERLVLLLAGGTVVYWAVILLMVGWLDRLTRGYMTQKLALIGLLAALGVPSLPFLF